MHSTTRRWSHSCLKQFHQNSSVNSATYVGTRNLSRYVGLKNSYNNICNNNTNNNTGYNQHNSKYLTPKYSNFNFSTKLETMDEKMNDSNVHSTTPFTSTQRDISSLDISKDALNIGFIGGGQMCAALCLAIVRSNILLPHSSITVTDKHQSCLDSMNEKTNEILKQQQNNEQNLIFNTTISNKSVIDSDIVVLAIKPQNTKTVLSELREFWTGNELIISIMAGVTTEEIESYFKPSLRQRVIRVMPNTPALVSSMAAGVCKGLHATDNDMKLVNDLMSVLGVCKTIEKEYLMDSVTGLSGSGPAYVYVFIEALADAGVKCGLSRSDALQLATQTVYGAAKMVKDTNIHPAVLKDQVTSPGGTAIAGVTALEHENFRHSVINAVQQATDRARALGRE